MGAISAAQHFFLTFGELGCRDAAIFSPVLRVFYLLKALVSHNSGETIQEKTVAHNDVEDSRACLLCLESVTLALDEESVADEAVIRFRVDGVDLGPEVFCIFEVNIEKFVFLIKLRQRPILEI